MDGGTAGWFKSHRLIPGSVTRSYNSQLGRPMRFLLQFLKILDHFVDLTL